MAIWIEASTNPNIEGFGPHEESFETASEAYERADDLASKFQGVWISERGTRVDNGKQDWFYFWWSSAVKTKAEWGDPEGRGRGYPLRNLSYIVDYKPLDQ